MAEKKAKMTRAVLQTLANEELSVALGPIEIVNVVGGIRLDMVDDDENVKKLATFSTMAIAREAIPAMTAAIRFST